MKGVGYAVWVGAGGDSEELRLEPAASARGRPAGRPGLRDLGVGGSLEGWEMRPGGMDARFLRF